MRKSSLIICLLVSLCVHAQQGQQQPAQPTYTKAYLESKRKEIYDAISETEHQLEELKKNKNATMSQLKALQYKLAQRQTLISNINDEIDNIDNSITTSTREIQTLKQKLETLKVRYAQSIRYSYQTRSSYDMIAFLFSSADFNDAVRRMKYLRKFRDFRKQQVDQIRNTQNQIQSKIGVLNKEKEEKDNMLAMQKNQSQALVRDVQETNSVMQSLKGKEAQLLKEAEKNRKTAARINKAINDIIEREMAAALKKAEEEERKRIAAGGAKPAEVPKPAKTNEPVIVPPAGAPRPKPTRTDAGPILLTPTDVALADKFEGNQGKLYWPVAQGAIADHFGTHPHPLAPRVMIENAGVDIRTTPGAAARAVFEGTVSSVLTVEGSQIVIIQHGNYFTVYNNLASVSVSKGQHVSTLQTIGVVATNDEGEPTIKFQVWKSNGKKGNVKLNPEAWIGRAR